MPNTHDYYFDIVADNYRIIEVNTLLELDDFPRKVTEEDDVKYFFEARKRREIEELIKKNMRIKTSPFKRNSTTNTPIKSSVLSKQHHSQYYKSPQQVPWTPNPYLKPQYAASQFLYSGGIKKSVGKESLCDDVLCIEELLDIPLFVPTIKRSVKKSTMKYSWGENSTKVTPNTKDASLLQKSSIKQVSTKYDSNKSTPSLASRTAKNVSMEDINDGLKSGLISWDQISFNRDAFSYLQKNLHIIPK